MFKNKEMKIDAIIIEDEERARSSLSKMLELYCPQVNVIAQVESVQEAKVVIDSEGPKLVFLDIHLPKERGFKLFEYYKDGAFEVIFTTAYSEYTLLALRLSAVDYLMKPINKDELKEAILKAQNRISDRSIRKGISALREIIDSNFKKLPLPSSNGYVYVKIENVLYCEADRNYCNFHLEGGKKILVSKNLKNYEQVLVNFGFMRVNRSYIVNLKMIDSFTRSNGGEVVMSNSVTIPISSNIKNELLYRLNSY